MSVARIIGTRDLRATFTTVAGFGVLSGFLALSGWTFAELLRRNEGGFASPVAIWAMAIAPWLPALAATATMRSFAEERQTGTLETLLTAPVQSFDLVLGKFMAAWALSLIGIVLAAVPVVLLEHLTPRMAGEFSAWGMVAAGVMLALEAAAWTAIGTLASLLAKQQSAAGVLTVACIGAPYALYAGLVAWLPRVRLSSWHWPPMEHVADAATGLFALAPPVFYLSLTLCALFVCARMVEGRNLRRR
jgi:ABC-2 type transport system permease protein